MDKLIHYSIPAFALLMLVEVLANAWMKREQYEVEDSASSIALGIGNVITGLFTKIVLFAILSFLYQYRLFDIGNSWWAWVLLFFADDFSYYWFHRVSHSSRYFWASHFVHHSSQRYNLSTALRQTWTGELSGAFVFWLWLPLLGYDPKMIMTMQAISLIYQFWIHTEIIQKFPPWFEWLFNTPSHHRVHHGSDIKYLDKNHAGILVIWDRMFGTFIAEEERPTYGLTANVNTYNPAKIAVYEWRSIWKDIRQPNITFKERWNYLFAPPGWSHDGSRKTTKELREKLAKEI